MNKKINKMILKAILSLTILISFNLHEISNTYAEEDNVSLLIQNQKKQKELKEKISELDNTLKIKNKELKISYNESAVEKANSSVEVVTVSFVPTNEDIQSENISKVEAINSEIVALEEYKNSLGKELQDTIIEGVQIEKILEEEVLYKLEKSNKEYITGIWPLNDYKEVSSGFGNRIHPITNTKKFHKGIDIPAPQDTSVLSTDDGIVSFSGYQNGYGNVIKIKHFDGKTTVYAHNNSLVVNEGDIVKQGQVIAKVGSTGDSTGNHVHFEIIVDGENINPIEGVIK
ncbi:MAG: M23 family metallopeptidase [Peptostreptococcaceae bacterium]